jgi:hypothetical protein
MEIIAAFFIGFISGATTLFVILALSGSIKS